MGALRLDLSQLAGYLDGLAGRALPDDWTPAFKTVALLLTADTRQRFQSGTDPDGVAWLPLKRPRRNSRGGDKPLLDTGVLQASVGSISEAGPTSLVWGTNLDYGFWQNYGTGTIPPRPFVGWSPAVVEKTRLVLQDFLEKWWERGRAA